MAVTLRVVLGVDDVSKLTLLNGMPDSVEALKEEIRRHFNLPGSFRLQYRDIDFDNDFFNLTNISEIEDKGTVKVIRLDMCDMTINQTVSPEIDETDTSIGASDTDILSSTESSSSDGSLRLEPWPQQFTIPKFRYDIQFQLDSANQDYLKNGTLFSPTPKLKSGILDGLASEIFKYKSYLKSRDIDEVAQALITKYPCLKEQGSFPGHYGWKIYLNNKIRNYRSVLRGIGCPEVAINSMKRKRSDTNRGPNQVKKPKKAEVNFCPPYPGSETKESLEREREELVLDAKKRNNTQLIDSKMEKTFSHRRREVVEDMPFIADFKSRWPALFSEKQINSEFTRITTVPLLSRFMTNLDQYSSKLMKIFKKKGGAAGRRINFIMASLDQCPGIEKRRECILVALCVYLNEDPDALIKTLMDADVGAAKELETVDLAIYTVQCEGAEPGDSLADVGVIIEGCTVIEDLRHVANGCAILFGLIYCLNLNYPKDLRYTFEFLQKVVMELDGGKLSNKVQILKNKLNE